MESTSQLPQALRWKLKTVAIVIFFHIGMAFSFCYVDETAIWTAVILFFVTSLGVTAGYHRCLTHPSFQTYKFMRGIFGVLGACAGQGDAVSWVALHRKHHQFSDKPGKDPHTPLEGVLWSHIFWLLLTPKDYDLGETRKKYAKDLLSDDVYLCFVGRFHWLWLTILGISLALTGYLIGGWELSLSMVLWGICFRVVCTWHFTWAVNSICHVWGYRNYETPDRSRNNWFVALFSLGEGWHNNHHDYQNSANHGHHRWWEIDLSYLFILLLRMVGLAWNVNHKLGMKKPKKMAA